MVQCFAGFTVNSNENFEFEVFPDLGFFRIRPFTLHSEKKTRWLGISAPLPKIDSREGYLPKDLSEKLLLVGSGLLKMDITNRGPLLAVKNNNYRTYEFPLWIEPFRETRRTALLLIGTTDEIEDYYVHNSQKWFSVLEVSP